MPLKIDDILNEELTTSTGKKVRMRDYYEKSSKNRRDSSISANASTQNDKKVGQNNKKTGQGTRNTNVTSKRIENAMKYINSEGGLPSDRTNTRTTKTVGPTMPLLTEESIKNYTAKKPNTAVKEQNTKGKKTRGRYTALGSNPYINAEGGIEAPSLADFARTSKSRSAAATAGTMARTVGNIGVALGSVGNAASEIGAAQSTNKSLKRELEVQKNLTDRINYLKNYKHKGDIDALVADPEYIKTANALHSYGMVINAVRERAAQGTEKNSFGKQLSSTGEELQQQALEGLGTGGRFAMNTAMSMGQNAMLLPLAFIPAVGPALYKGAMAASVMGDKVTDVERNGGSSREAMARGLGSGAITYTTERLGLENLMKTITGENIAKNGGKAAIKSILKNANRQGLAEGTEEGIEYAGNAAADLAAGDKNAHFNFNELGGNMLGGYAAGAAMSLLGSGMGAFNNYTSPEGTNGYNTRTREMYTPPRDGINTAKRNELIQRAYLMDTAEKNNLAQRLYMDNYENPNLKAMDREMSEYLKKQAVSHEESANGEPLMSPIPNKGLNKPLNNIDQTEISNLKEDNINNVNEVEVKYNFDENILKEAGLARKNIIEYARKMFPKSVVVKSTGMKVSIARNGLDKLLSGRIGKEKYATAFYVPEIIENGYNAKYSDYKTPYGGKKENINGYTYLESNLNIEGEPYTAHIRVRHSDNKNNYYGHTISKGIVDEIQIEPSQKSSHIQDMTSPVNAIEDKSSARTDAINTSSLLDGSNSINADLSISDNTDVVKGNPKSIVDEYAQNGIEMPESAAKSISEAENSAKSASAQERLKIQTTDPDAYRLGFIDLKQNKATNKILMGMKKAYRGLISGQESLEAMQRISDKNAKAEAKAAKKRGESYTYDDPMIDINTQLVRQAGGTVDQILEKGLYDPSGKKVSDTSYAGIVKSIPKKSLAEFNDYLQNKHNISRMTLEERYGSPNKPVNGKSAEESRHIVADYESTHPEFKGYAQNLRNYWNEFTKTWLLDTGMIDSEGYARLQDMYPDYVPTYRKDKGGAGGGGIAGKKVSTPNVIGKAKGATSEIIPFEESFATNINNIVRAVRKNEMSRSIGKFADFDPELAATYGVKKSVSNGGDLDVDSLITGIDEAGDTNLKELKNGGYTVTYYENGKKVTMDISKGVYDAYRLLQNASGIESDILKLMAYQVPKTLTSPMKAAITGSNPVFAMANIARDVQTYAINASANPIHAGSNWVKAFFGVLRQTEQFNEYKALGGSQSGYYNTSEGMSKAVEGFKDKNIAQKTGHLLTTPLRAINAMNELTEATTRFAEYKNTIDKYGNTPEGRKRAAANAADVTVNFARSGPVTKFFDASTPYLNAGVQGMDNFYRGIRNRPVQTVTRAAIALALPTMLLGFANKDNPYYEELNQRIKDAYFCIPNLLGDTEEIDGKNYAKTFIKIPKAEQWGVWASTFIDRCFQYAESGDMENSFKGFGNTVATGFTPNNPFNGNVLGPILFNLPKNKDFADRNIVSPTFINGNVPPEYQYDAQTSGLARSIANMANGLPDNTYLNYLKSPQQVDYLLDSYAGYFGDLGQSFTAPENKGRTAEETARNTLYNTGIKPFVNRFTADPLYSNASTDKMYNEYDKAKEESARIKYGTDTPEGYTTPEKFKERFLSYGSEEISKIRKNEQEILKSAGSYKDKQKEISEGRKKMAEIAKWSVENSKKEYENYKKDYASLKKNSVFKALSEDGKGKATNALGNYYIIKARKGMNVGYESTDDEKTDALKKAGFTTAEAVAYKQGISEAGEKANEKLNYIQCLDLSSEKKKILGNTYVNKDGNYTFTNGKGSLTSSDYILGSMGTQANRAWDNFFKGDGNGIAYKGVSIDAKTYKDIVEIIYSKDYKNKEERNKAIAEKYGISVEAAESIRKKFYSVSK